jgi:hypothetical protein
LDAGLGLSLFQEGFGCVTSRNLRHMLSQRDVVLTRRRYACQLRVCMELHCGAAKSSVSDAQQSARDIHRDERVKDGRDARAEGSDSLD